MPNTTKHTQDLEPSETRGKDICAEINEVSSVRSRCCESLRAIRQRAGVYQRNRNFWALLKRTLNGTYVAVEPYHLQKYVDEQIFRFDNRSRKQNPLNDSDRFMLAASQIVGKRLTYTELTGKEGETKF